MLFHVYKHHIVNSLYCAAVAKLRLGARLPTPEQRNVGVRELSAPPPCIQSAVSNNIAALEPQERQITAGPETGLCLFIHQLTNGWH